MIWQILITSTLERHDQFELLLYTFLDQIKQHNLEGIVDVIYDIDNKEKSIGKKRQDLLEKSTAKYINYFDDDDWPYQNYVEDIYNALQYEPDAVGVLINMTTNGSNPQVCCHSLRYFIWQDKKDGYDYVRNITHFNPILRELAIQVGFEDCRFGEDKIYSDQVTKLCNTEVFLENPVFHYRYSNKIIHAEKYGIK